MKVKCTALAAAILLGVTGFAEASQQSLEQIRYELYKNPNADVKADLIYLADRGDLKSKLLLGDLISEGDAASARTSLKLYKEAFLDGAGEVAAITSISRLLARNPRLKAENLEFIRVALGRYQHSRDPQSLVSTLEAFLVYPDLFGSKEASELIALYKASCLNFCRPALYEAALADKNGDSMKASDLYKDAIFYDTRAVVLYYESLGVDKDSKFIEFAGGLSKDSLPVESVHRIATLLDTIYSTKVALMTIDGRIQQESLKNNPSITAKQIDEVSQAHKSQQLQLEAKQQNDVTSWLANGVRRNWVPAMVSMLNNMTSSPTDYTPEEAFLLIEKINEKDPKKGKALKVSVLMVTNWRTLDPEQAFSLINELIEEGYPGAELLLADLYTKGVLNEPDIKKSLEILNEQGQKGSPSAFYRMATIYGYGKAICHDYVKAHANAAIAKSLGEFRANGLLDRLEREMTQSDLDKSITLQDKKYEEYSL